MYHPALKHIRHTLIAALGLTGCIEQAPSTVDPAVDAMFDGPPLDGAVIPDRGPDSAPPLTDALPDRAVDAAPVDMAPDARPDLAPELAPPCDGVPIPGAEGRPSGYVRCADGSIDRVGPARCIPEAPAGRCPMAAAEAGACAVDSDCADGAFGRCDLPAFPGPEGCFCSYGCATDADCRDDEACACALGDVARVGRCVPAPCTEAADCAGGRCGLATFYESCVTISQLGCRSVADTCADNGDCEPCDGDGFCAAECWPAGVGGGNSGVDDRWRCDEPDGVCGRPLRVGALPRMAPTMPRGGWQCAATTARVPSATAARLAAHWASIGALEHASVGSFARFSLQLLALGAPADLLADCQRAAADEVEHARLAYGIASAFAGEPIGPGPLSLRDVDLAHDPAEVLREVIIEGCIGETFGALEAAAAAKSIDDPGIAAACARIAEDELRHAALGWRTARWLLARDPRLSAVAARAFNDGIAVHTAELTPTPTEVACHGIAVRPAARRAAVQAVIEPLASALLRGAV